MIGKTVKYESGYGIFDGVVIEELDETLIVESEGTQFFLGKDDVLETIE